MQALKNFQTAAADRYSYLLDLTLLLQKNSKPAAARANPPFINFCSNIADPVALLRKFHNLVSVLTPLLGMNSYLHRSPSGAQRRIRQRLGGEWPLQRSNLSASSNLSNSTENIEPYSANPSPSLNNTHRSPMGYRDLIESSAYQSLLPENDYRGPRVIESKEEKFDLSNGSSISLNTSFGTSTPNTHIKPTPMPRSHEHTGRQFYNPGSYTPGSYTPESPATKLNFSLPMEKPRNYRMAFILWRPTLNPCSMFILSQYPETSLSPLRFPRNRRAYKQRD